MKVLLVDPQDDSRDALRRSFAGAGDQVRGVPSLAEASRQIAEFSPDAVVAALDFPEGELYAFFDEAGRPAPRRALGALADSDCLEAGVRAMRRGAHDFLWRPVSAGRVALLRSRLESRRQRESWLEEMRVRLARAEIAASLAGRSSRWKAALDSIEREAANESAVLVTGEPGTEKEAAALAIHRLSRRGSEPFLAVPADRPLPRDGAGGTLLVVGVIRSELERQRELLSEIERPAGRRLLVSTDLDPRAAVEGGLLLPELAAAIEPHVVHLPPLRERGDDVQLLATRFLQDLHGSPPLR